MLARPGSSAAALASGSSTCWPSSRARSARSRSRTRCAPRASRPAAPASTGCSTCWSSTGSSSASPSATGQARFERSTPAARTTTTWSASTAAGWWPSTTRGWSGRSTGCRRARGAGRAPRRAAARRLRALRLRQPTALTRRRRWGGACRPLPPRGRVVVEQRRDPAAAVGGVDHVVDLEVGGHADPLAALVGGGDGVPRRLARARRGPRSPRARGASRAAPRPRGPSPPNSAVGHADREQRRLEAAARPSPARRGRSPCAARSCRSGPSRLAPVTNMREKWRTVAVFSASGPTMKPGVSHRNSSGSPNASHSCMNRAALSAPSASIAPPRWAGLLAITPSGRPSSRGRAR